MVKKVVLPLIAVFLLFIIGVSYRNNSFSFHFVDEEDNFVVAKYLTKGERLYGDIFTNHLPASYLISAGIQKITQPNSLYLLVRRHREFMILFSTLWFLFLVIRFGSPVLLVLIGYEGTKYFLLGHLFLAESISVYPLIYLVSLVVGDKKIIRVEMILVGFCLAFILLILAPLWPLLALIFIALFLTIYKDRIKIACFLVGFTIPILVVVPFISLKGFFHDFLYINQRFFIPLSGEKVFNLNSFLSPLLVFLPEKNITGTLIVTKIVSLLFLINILFAVKKKDFRIPILSLIILGLSNIRFIIPGSQQYAGFHLIPWYALMLLFSIVISFKYFREERMPIKIINVFLWSAIIFQSFILAKGSIFLKRNINQDLYINYSRQFDTGEAVNVMRSPGEKLFVASDETLIYWQANIDHAIRSTNYYSWISKVPEFSTAVEEMFNKKPPEYIYCNNCDQFPEVNRQLLMYKRLTKKGDKTNLYVLLSTFSSLSDSQKSKLSFYTYDLR